MIVVVCLNPALDVTYHVDALVRGESVEVRCVAERAGGKGVNVARVLAALGVRPLVLGFAGGRYRSLLDSAEFDTGWTDIAGATRRTVTVVDGRATVLREPGPVVSCAEWSAFLRRFREAVAARPEVVVLSGSLPAGVPSDAYATLISAADDAGVPAVLDAAGDALRAGLAARPYLAKPNAAEARALGDGDAVEAILRAGARNAIVSWGAQGLVAVLSGRRFRASGPVTAGNPTGAGDALTAVLARGIADGRPWADMLREGVATAAAAVAAPVAGEFDARVAAELLQRVTVEEM